MKNSLHGLVSRLNTSSKRKTKLGLAKMAKYKDLELFSYSRHTKITMIYSTPISEKAQNLQEKIIYN